MTVSDMIARQTRLFAAALEWQRSSRALSQAVTTSDIPGAETWAIRQRHAHAAAALAEIVDEIDDAQLPAVGNGTSGSARRVTQLEGAIALQAIAWFHARDANPLYSLYGLERLADEAAKLHELARELVDELGRIGAAA